jgi:hypothetical protein
MPQVNSGVWNWLASGDIKDLNIQKQWNTGFAVLDILANGFSGYDW